MRFEDDDVQIGKRSQRLLNAASDLRPWKSAKAGTERWHSHGTQTQTTDFGDEGHQSRVDVHQPRLAAPMTLGGEVDDVARRDGLAGLVDEHSARLYLAVATSSGVGSEVVWPRLLELQRDAGAHVPDAVHRVDESVGLLRQQVSGLVLDHRPSPMVSSTTGLGSRLPGVGPDLEARSLRDPPCAASVHQCDRRAQSGRPWGGGAADS